MLCDKNAGNNTAEPTEKVNKNYYEGCSGMATEPIVY